MKKCRFSETLTKTVLIFLECPKSFLDILNVGFQLLLVQRSLQFSGLAPCSILMNIEVYYIMNSAYTCFKSQTTLTKDIELLEGKYPENLLEGRISRHSGQGYSFCQNMNGNLNWRNAIARQTNTILMCSVFYTFIWYFQVAMTIEWGIGITHIKYWQFVKASVWGSFLNPQELDFN